MKCLHWRRYRVALFAVSLSAGLLVGPFAPGHVSAAFAVCSGDPVLQLSNGMSVRLSVFVHDPSPADVATVSYTVYGPVGTTLTNVTYQGDLANKETVTYVADQGDGRSYVGDTVVTMHTGAVRTVVVMTVYGTSSGKGFAGSAAAGPSGTDLLTVAMVRS